MPISQYKDEIKRLRPLKLGCVYQPENWYKHLSNKKHLNCINEYKSKDITRQVVIDAYASFYNHSDKSVIKPFLLTMIWGFETSGYGPHRTNKYLTGNKNINLIRKCYEAIDNNDIDESFKKLLLIKGLGISFLSKVLYFAGRGKGLTKYPLIFDQRVAKGLVSLLAGNDISEILEIHPSNRLTAYKNYNTLIHKWSAQLKVDSEQIEYFLFAQPF